MRKALVLSGEALRWALRFYGRHTLLVFGLSLVPTVQRFVVVGYDVPTAAAVSSEVLVALVRLLLVVLVVRLMLAELGCRGGPAWRRLTAAIGARRTEFWLQWVVLAAAFVVFDVLPTVAIALWVPESARDTVNATLVAVKNPTVIAMTVLWMAGVARMLIAGQGEARAPEAAEDAATRRRS
jgi:hypothetical protein